MPALPKRKKNKPFKEQSELRSPRTMAKLRTYSKRRAAYANMQLLCFLTFFTYFHETLWHLWKEDVKIKARPGNRRRQARHRKLQRILLRIARLQERRAQLAAQISVLEARVTKRSLNLRKHATAHQGTVDGFGAATSMDEVQLKALHFSLRYRIAYCEAVAQKAHWTAVMQKQSTPVVQPATIKL
jgi:hypothetical protein